MQRAEHILSPQQPMRRRRAADLIDVTLQGFRAEVMEESTAPSGAGRFLGAVVRSLQTLGPVLEKLVKAARGKIRLAKMNIDHGLRSPKRWEYNPFRRSSPSRAARWSTDLSACSRKRDQGLHRTLRSDRTDPTSKPSMPRRKRCWTPATRKPREPAFMTAMLASSIRPMSARAPGQPGCLSPAEKFDEAKGLLDAIPINQVAGCARSGGARRAGAGRTGRRGRRSRRLAARVEKAPDDHQARYELAVALNAAGTAGGGGDGIAAVVQARPRLERRGGAEVAPAIVPELGTARSRDAFGAAAAVVAVVFVTAQAMAM